MYTMTQYDKTFGEWLTVAYPPVPLNNTLGDISLQR
jgi:bisphosphoglycerate-independent phosphoglycerate mutase (AlkP superfamily)